MAVVARELLICIAALNEDSPGGFSAITVCSRAHSGRRSLTTREAASDRWGRRERSQSTVSWLDSARSRKEDAARVEAHILHGPEALDDKWAVGTGVPGRRLKPARGSIWKSRRTRRINARKAIALRREDYCVLLRNRDSAWRRTRNEPSSRRDACTAHSDIKGIRRPH